jgi:hypothetical protein
MRSNTARGVTVHLHSTQHPGGESVPRVRVTLTLDEDLFFRGQLEAARELRDVRSELAFLLEAVLRELPAPDVRIARPRELVEATA